QQEAPTPRALPLERITTKQEMQTMLELYYSKYAPVITIDDCEIVVESCFDSMAARLEFDDMLKKEYGTGLNDFIAQLERGTLRRPRNTMQRRRKDDQVNPVPAIKMPTNPAALTTEEGAQSSKLTLDSDFATAIEEHGLG